MRAGAVAGSIDLPLRIDNISCADPTYIPSVCLATAATCHAPDRAACFKQIFKALKPGGVFGGCVPTPLGWRVALILTCDDRRGPFVQLPCLIVTSATP